MATVIFGNYTAVRVSQAERDRIRAFYRDVLGCTLMREFDDKDDFRMGGEFYFAFLYESGRGVAVDEGVSYAAADALSADDFLKAIFLELKTDDVDEMRRVPALYRARGSQTPIRCLQPRPKPTPSSVPLGLKRARTRIHCFGPSRDRRSRTVLRRR